MAWPWHFIARQPTMLLFALSVASSPLDCSLCFRQQDRSLDATVSDFLQQLGESCSCFLVQQILGASSSTSNPMLRASASSAELASASANAGGFTPCLRAQASRSASVWQQHDFQHCSAEVQPHLHVEQGNNSPRFARLFPVGSGTPDTVQESTITSSALPMRRAFWRYRERRDRRAMVHHREEERREYRRAIPNGQRPERMGGWAFTPFSARSQSTAATKSTAAWPCGVTLRFKKLRPAAVVSSFTTVTGHSGSGVS